MQFYEKLTFLMDLTQVSNRMLSQELQVDPSLISRLRRGNRRLPRNREHIKVMSQYFSKRSNTEYQRQALSEMLGIRQAYTMKKEQLADILFYWLCGEADEVGHFMRTFESFNLESVSTPPAQESCRLGTENSVYYGNEGKRAAARAFYLHLLSLEEPGDVLIFADESDNWITEEYGYAGLLQNWSMELINRGFQIIQVIPPTTWVEQAFDSLLRWFPLYMTGKVSAYYYPRMRDNMHRRTLMIMPGEIALTSNSSAGITSVHASFLTTDWRLSQAYAAEFEDLLALCQPMLHTHTVPEDLMRCFTRFLTDNGARIQRVSSLSAETAPPELVEYCYGRIKEPNLKKLSALYQQEMALIEKKWEKYGLIDIVRLPDVETIRQGKIPVILSLGGETNPVFYTPDLYILHLQNILRLLETCENYHFIPLPDSVSNEGTLMVRERQRALLVHTTAPFAVFEVSEPDIVLFCHEHLLHIAERAGYTGIGRIKIISRIKELIRELQS